MKAKTYYLISLCLIALSISLMMPTSPSPPAQEILFQTDFSDPEHLDYFDIVGPRGTGDREGSFASLSTTEFHSSPQSMLMYQKEPPKTNPDRRVGIYKLPTTSRKIYLEWWFYVHPTLLEFDDWHGLGSSRIIYYPRANSPYVGERFVWNAVAGFGTASYGGTRILRAKSEGLFVHMKDSPSDNPNEIKEKFFYDIKLSDYVNTWVKLAIWHDLGDENGGLRQWFFNGQLIWEDARLFAPEYDSRWESLDCTYTYPEDRNLPRSPNLAICLRTYCHYDQPEHYYYIDDLVIATEPPNQ